MGNALKFRAEAPPRVEISGFRGAREWAVTVRDNGVASTRWRRAAGAGGSTFRFTLPR